LEIYVLNIYITAVLAPSSRELPEAASRMKIPFIADKKIFSLFANHNDQNTKIWSVTDDQARILVRYVSEFFEVVPTIVTAVPGAQATSTWNTIVASWPTIDFIELQRKLVKSGSVANDVESADKMVDHTGSPTMPVDVKVRAVTFPDDNTDSDDSVQIV